MIATDTSHEDHQLHCRNPALKLIVPLCGGVPPGVTFQYVLTLHFVVMFHFVVMTHIGLKLRLSLCLLHNAITFSNVLCAYV